MSCSFKKAAMTAVSVFTLLMMSGGEMMASPAKAPPIKLTNEEGEGAPLPPPPPPEMTAQDEAILDQMGTVVDVPVVPAVPPAPMKKVSDQKTSIEARGTPKKIQAEQLSLVATGLASSASLPTSEWDVKQSTLPTGFYEPGKPAPCVATRHQEGNGLIQLAASGQKLYALTFESDEFGLSQSDGVPLTLVIDRDPAPVKLMAQAVTTQTLMVHMTDPEGMYRRLKNADHLTLLVEKKNGSVVQLRYDLSGVHGTFASMEKCLSSVNKKLAALSRPTRFSAVPGGDKIIPGRVRREEAIKSGRALPPPIWPEDSRSVPKKGPEKAAAVADRPAPVSVAKDIRRQKPVVPLPAAPVADIVWNGPAVLGGDAGAEKSSMEQKLAALRGENEKIRIEMEAIKQAVADDKKQADAHLSDEDMGETSAISEPEPIWSVTKDEAYKKEKSEIDKELAALRFENEKLKSDLSSVKIMAEKARLMAEERKLPALPPMALVPTESSGNLVDAKGGDDIPPPSDKSVEKASEIVWDAKSEAKEPSLAVRVEPKPPRTDRAQLTVQGTDLPPPVVQKISASVSGQDHGEKVSPESYRARKGEYLRDVLRRWADRAGIDLVWDLKTDVVMTHEFSFVGEFEDALNLLLAAYPEAGIKTTFAPQGVDIDYKPFIEEANPPHAMPVVATGPSLDDFTPPPPPSFVAENQKRISASSVPVGPVKRWRALQGASMRQVMEAWAEEAQVNLLWLARNDFAVRYSITQSSDYASAVSDLLGQYNFEPVRPTGQLYQDPKTGQKTLVVR